MIAAMISMSSVARADTVTVGLFAPASPFPSTAARVELASRLGEQLGKALGATGTGKVFARAGDFAAAVKRGEVTIAVVDAAYLAAVGGNYTVVAAAVRGGDATGGWQLVGHGIDKLASLKGKRVLVPTIGGRETDFVINVLFGGDGRDFFGKIEAAPDTASALAAVGLGKADAAVVPAGVELPSGTATVMALPSLPGAVLVVYGTVDKAALATAAIAFKGDATITGFRAADGDAVKAVARRFSPPVKRGPLTIPAIRLLVGDLVEGRTLVIERTPVTVFAVGPVARP